MSILVTFKTISWRVLPHFRTISWRVAYKSNDEFIATVIPDYVNKNPATEYGEEKFKPDKDLTMQNLRIQRERRLAAGDGISISDIKVGPKTFTGTKLRLFDKNTGKPIMDSSGKKQLTKGKAQISSELSK